MRIGIDIRNIGKGRTGDEVVFFNLVKNLSQIDKTNEYWLFTDRNPKKDQFLCDEIKKMKLRNNFTVINLGEAGINKFVWNFWTLPRFVRKNPLDVYLTQYIVPFFVPKRTKIITIIHDVSFRVYPKMIKKIDLFFLNLFIPLSLKRADLILGVSRFTSQEILKYYPAQDEKKIDWFHNSVSDNFLNFNFLPEKTEVIKNKYELPEKFILYLGTLQPRKNIPMLISAFSQLSKTEPELRLVLAGGRGYNFDQKIEEKIEEMKLQKKVIFPGFISEEDKPYFFHLAQVFCFPSLYEGFGIPILEAFAFKTPVVASRIPSHIEVAGSAALLFDTRKTANLKKNLEDILAKNDLRKSLIAKGEEKLKEFSWEKTAQKMLKFFQQLDSNNKH